MVGFGSALFAVSTLAAAGLGNLVSDVVGLGAGGVIEAGAAKAGVEAPALTAAQAASRGAAVARHSGSAGISLGCLLGMFPLLFYDEDTARLRTIFARYDADGNGSLDRSELRSAFADAKTFRADADLDGLLRRYGVVDGDGCIGYDEFEKMVATASARTTAARGDGGRFFF
ncbi:transmembrane protein [Aureococcus anophagefferens]|uniref:Transmembrane protein n=1 Tax=Aureococcus anophagefferens TaxID=44056 RepID=A0ABR1FJA3_AURAN